MKFTSLLVALAIAGTAAALAPTSLARSPSSSTQGELNVGDEIRASIRWMRSAQDPLAGSYGGSVEPTALVLRAFAECPDRYRAADGPFVRKGLEYLVAKQRADGSICDEKASADACRVQTRLATQALLALPDPAHSQALARALAFLGEKDVAAEGWDSPPKDETPEQALARARELVSKRATPESWDGPAGRVAETAKATIQLSQIERVLSKNKKASAPVEAARLPAFTPVDRDSALAAVKRGAEFLASVGPDGRFGAPGKPDAGLTAMALAGMQTLPAPRSEPVQKSIDLGLAWLVSLQKDDGSIHDGKLANYITSASILALSSAKKKEYEPAIARARKFLQTLQADEGEGYSEGDVYYGGIGYGSTERPDLSNLQMALEALAASGVEKDAPTYTKALRFLERCQNRSESNDVKLIDGQIVIASGDDGGAGYAPGDSKAGFVEVDGKKIPRSYGSMTYALLKCYLFAGLPKDDPRMQAAWEWCKKNYTLDVNPGFEGSADPSAAYQGLFYYLHTLARALDAYGEESIKDASGKDHAWRTEVCGRLVAMQSKEDGSWLNRNSPRWYEGNPLLATAHALLALDAAMPRVASAR